MKEKYHLLIESLFQKKGGALVAGYDQFIQITERLAVFFFQSGDRF